MLVVDYYKYKGLDDDQCFWFGSDYLGRDIWTRMWRGARVSLIIAIVSVCCNVFIGVVYGSIAGYYGGKVDMVMMRITEIINAFPRIVVVTLFIMIVRNRNVLHHHVFSYQRLGQHGTYGFVPSSIVSKVVSTYWQPEPWVLEIWP